MNNQSKRLLTILLALFMILTSFPLNAFAAQTETNVRNEITDIRTVGDKQVINLGTVKGQSRSNLGFFSGASRFLGFTTQQAGSSSKTVAQKVEINLDTMGLNLEEDQFDPSALTEVGSFDVEITFKELGGTRTETRTMTFQAGETKKTETFYLPQDMGQGVVKAEIPKLKDTISLRVYVGANSTTNFTVGQDMTYKFELTQIVHPVIDLKVVDPYGKELQENINQALGLKLALEDEHEFDLPANTKTFNIRTLTDFAGDNVADLNSTGTNPTLSLTTAIDANKRLTIAGKTYKLNKITYKALGQEVEINGQKKKVGGYIEFATQPKIIVPTPDEEGNLPKKPDGYKRLSFHAETSSNANDGKFENGEKLKVIDVLEGTEFKDQELLDNIAKIKNPTAYLNGSKDDSKKFLKWNPALPTDKTEEKVKDTDYWAVYLADGGEITPGEKLPDGVFEVKVIKDETIAADPLYGKSYGVFKGSKLRRDKFPDLEAEKGHQNPKWTTEAETPATGMVEIKKPWTKVIEKNTTFKATAGADAATQIGQNGLKAVDTIALQGQELTEEFWHKGVALADNTPEDKKDAFAALLKDATVTDKSSRTTAEAGDKVGTLLVTFKDGSTLEVEKQKLIVKPNTVTVTLDKAAGKEHPLRDGDTTVKGKIAASSNSKEFPVSLENAVVTIKKGDTVLSRTLANADGSFVAGVKDPLIAGQDISVVVTLPGSTVESAPVTQKVQLNPDKLNEIIPTGNEVVKNLKGKKGVDQTKVAKLEEAIQKAYNELVDKAGENQEQKNQKVKSTVEVSADGQKSLDDQYEAIKKAIEALTDNKIPTITGPDYKEIFVGKDLDLTEGIKVEDEDGEDDLVKDGQNKFTYTVNKVETTQQGVKETNVKKEDIANIKNNVGTYKVTYTAKDKSGATAQHTMELAVKEIKVTKIEVTADPTNDQKYLVRTEDGKATPDYTGMVVTLTKNDGTTETATYDSASKQFKNGEKVITELTVEPTEVGLTGKEPQRIIAKYTKDESKLTAEATKKIIVQLDKDGDGTADETQNFDITKAVKIEVLTDPAKMTYKQGENLDPKGMVVQVTDKAGKVKVADVTDDSWKDKFTFEPDKNLQAPNPAVADGETGKHVTVTITGVVDGQQKPVKDQTKGTLKVLVDADGDGVDDRTQTTDKPFITAARNIPTSKEDKTPKTVVEGIAKPGVKIEIKAADESGAPTGEVLGTVETVGTDGTYKVTLDPKQNAGTKLVAIATEGKKKPSTSDPKKVIDDMDEDGNDDNEQGFNIEKATDIKFVDQPDLTYLVKTKDTEVTFNGKDGKGKSIYLELSYKNGEKTESKIMTLEDLMKDKEHIAVTPANGTTDKKENQTHELVGKAIDVKLVKADKTATSESKFAIEIDADGNKIADKDEKTPAPTAKALNVGKAPTTTTITGKAVAGAKVVAKVGEDVVGETTADSTTGKYTIEAKKDNAALPKDTKVEVTAKDGEKQTSDPTEAIVKEDKDGNGVADDEEKFDIKKATKVEIIKNPDKMDYLVNTPNGKAKFETAGLVVKFTDDSGKSATYTAEELAKMKEVTIKPANNDEIGLTPEGKTNKMDLTVTVTGAEATDKPTAKADRQVTVKLDADGNNIADEDEESAMPENVKAMNQNKVDPQTKEVTDKEKDTTTVTGKVKPGATVKITSEDGETDLTPSQVNIDNEGNFTAEITKQKVGTKIKVWATEPGKKISKPAPADVFRDSNNDGEDDSKAGQTERPAAIASNKGKNPAFTTIEGKTEKGAVITVTVKVDGGEKPVTVENLKVNDDGTYTLEAKYDKKPLENGAEILVYAENAPKKISKPQTTTVFNDVNKDGKPDGGKADLTDVKDIQVIAPKKMSYTQGDKLDGTGLKAVIRDNGGNIEIFDYDNATGKFKNADNEEVADITATVNGKTIKDLPLTAKDHNGKAIDVVVGGKTWATNQTLEVKQLQTPTPTIEFAANQNTVGSDGKTPTGTAKQKTTVKFTVKNKPTTVYVKYTDNGVAKEESFEIGANDELTKIVDLQVKLPVGAEVKVLAKDADKTLSEAAKAKVVRDANNDGTADDKTPVGKAAIDPIKAQSDSITVKPADNATELVIKETDKSGNTPAGSTPITVTKDKDGNWKIGKTPVEKDEETGKLTIPKGTFKLDEYNVVEVESKGEPDTTTPSTSKEVVGKAKDTTAPAMPKVDQPVDGDKDIKVKTPTESDAKTITVEIATPAKPGEKPTKKTVEVTKGDDGKWKTPDGKDVPEENGKLVIPVPELKTGDTVTVEVKDESGNGSKSDPKDVIAREQLPAPTINPIKTGEKTVAGKAEKAATVDIYKKNAEGKYDLIKEGVAVGADGSYTYNDPTGFKDGDVIRVVAKKDGWTPNATETTAGVDTTELDKAITDGKDSLDPEKGGKNNGTKADKDLEKAIQEGEDIKKKTKPAPATQGEIDAEKDKIVKAIEEKKAYDEARDKLQEKINEANDKKNDPEYPNKPDDVKKELDESATEGQTTHDNKDSSKEAIDKATKKIQEKIDQYNKQQIGVNIRKVTSNDKTIVVVVTAPNAKVEVFKSEVDWTTFKTVLTPLGETTDITRLLIVSLDNSLPTGTKLFIKVTHPDYLSYEDNITVE